MNAYAQIKITDSSNWSDFERIDKEFSRTFSTDSVAVCDGVDEAYYDHHLDGTIVTVHLQHYLGVRVFLRYPEKATPADLLVLQRIKEHFEKAPISEGSVSPQRETGRGLNKPHE